jgi:hypothetical protein
MAVALGRAWSARPSLRALARRVDAAAGAEGLLGTALAVERGRAHGDAALQARVLAAAAAAAPGLAQHARTPGRWPVGALVAGAVMAVVGLVAPAEHASPGVQVVQEVVRVAVGGPASPAPAPGAEEADGGAAGRERVAQAGAGPRGERGVGRATRGSAGAAGDGGAGEAGAQAMGLAADGEAAGEASASRPELERPERPASAVDMLMSTPGTGQGDQDEGAPIQGGNQGAFDVQGVDEGDPTNPDAEMPWSGGEASGKQGGPEADEDTPAGETPNGAASGDGEGERKEGTGEGQAGSPGDPADGGPAPKGGEDARSKDDSQTTGPGAGAGADAIGTADAESDRPVALPPLPDALSRIELAWKEGGDGTLREVEDAALGQRSTQAWRALHADYAAVAEHTLAREAVPPARADAVRRYFDALAAEPAKDEP